MLKSVLGTKTTFASNKKLQGLEMHFIYLTFLIIEIIIKYCSALQFLKQMHSEALCNVTGSCATPRAVC